jgi:mono/diheme cytochrome c family protein
MRIVRIYGIFAIVTTSIVIAEEKVDFNTQIKSILSNKCIACHGPDEEHREAGLRLDTFDGATEDLGGYAALIPGDADDSEMIFRMGLDSDDEEIMPPKGKGDPLTEEEIELFSKWINQGGEYDKHWSYKKPVRPAAPTGMHPVDHFVQERLKQEGLKPANPADKRTIIRRVFLDLIGLPPTPAEVDAFVQSQDPNAYNRLIDDLLARPTFGEHWARMWLDLARYADSAGYADDVPRTIWAYRDYVIRALNENVPFDQFTIDQLAGDLLSNPTDDQLIATAFHRNTQTNNEGGTNDEEFRNVAVVDRVNTTFATWMGTTMACAQCHTHKYDPITHEEYFQVFDILNQTEDSDKKDERPVYSIYSDHQKKRQSDLKNKISELERSLKPSTENELLLTELKKWEVEQKQTKWNALVPTKGAAQSGADLNISGDGTVFISGAKKPLEEYELSAISSLDKITAVRIDLLKDARLPHNGPSRIHNMVLNELILNSFGDAAEKGSAKRGRFVRLELPGKHKLLHIAEVQAFVGDENVALKGKATQSSTDYGGDAKLAIDGNVDGNYNSKSVTHTANSDEEPWLEIDLGKEYDLTKIAIWNRTDNKLYARLDGFRLQVLDEERVILWEKTYPKAPQREAIESLDGATTARFARATASYEQNNFTVDEAIDGKQGQESGWAIAGGQGRDHYAIFELKDPLPGGVLNFRLVQNYPNHAIGKFRLSVTNAKNPALAFSQSLTSILDKPTEKRSLQEQKQLLNYFVKQGPATQRIREQIVSLRNQLNQMKPSATVPMMKEVVDANRRESYIHLRGSYLSKGPTVHAGFPSALAPALDGVEKPTRLDLAKWLMQDENPLTSRVTANRFWEKLFGIGLVATSEEFGAQGELPSHPKLLDWLATEIIRIKWDTKEFIKLLVTSETYKQNSHVTNDLAARDPLNRLLARGPRIRLSAEMVRDQALSVAGLLSSKMYGAPVRPPQPDLGLKAAFGSGIDWKTSDGEDRYRRGIYVTWRRSNPYPSMVTFDATNREVCTVRRDRTNTPLQALVTLNDPVYVEAAQSLARTMDKSGNTPTEKLSAGFEACLSRSPSNQELDRLVALFNEMLDSYSKDKQLANKMATDPIGPVPRGADVSELAALTVAGNVLLNLDEMMMKR